MLKLLIVEVVASVGMLVVLCTLICHCLNAVRRITLHWLRRRMSLIRVVEVLVAFCKLVSHSFNTVLRITLCWLCTTMSLASGGMIRAAARLLVVTLRVNI